MDFCNVVFTSVDFCNVVFTSDGFLSLFFCLLSVSPLIPHRTMTTKMTTNAILNVTLVIIQSSVLSMEVWTPAPGLIWSLAWNNITWLSSLFSFSFSFLPLALVTISNTLHNDPKKGEKRNNGGDSGSGTYHFHISSACYTTVGRTNLRSCFFSFTLEDILNKLIINLSLVHVQAYILRNDTISNATFLILKCGHIVCVEDDHEVFIYFLFFSYKGMGNNAIYS